MKIHIILDTDSGNISYTIEGNNKQKISKSQIEMIRLKKFMEIINRETINGQNAIKEDDLKSNLILAGFINEEIEEYIIKAMQNGQIYESKSGWYKKG